jgi:phosphoglycolate phosphatase-like HAD superfamily hydrolase
MIGCDDELSYQTALVRFQAYCQRELENAPLIPGVQDFLEDLQRRNVPMFVVSGSDQTELRRTLEKKQLIHYFQSILGSPVSKRDNLKNLIKAHHLGGRGVFFGDARLDFEIASENGLAFVFVHGFSDWSEGREFCETRGLACIPDFQHLTYSEPALLQMNAECE